MDDVKIDTFVDLVWRGQQWHERTRDEDDREIYERISALAKSLDKMLSDEERGEAVKRFASRRSRRLTEIIQNSVETSLEAAHITLGPDKES